MQTVCFRFFFVNFTQKFDLFFVCFNLYLKDPPAIRGHRRKLEGQEHGSASKAASKWIYVHVNKESFLVAKKPKSYDFVPDWCWDLDHLGHRSVGPYYMCCVLHLPEKMQQEP